MSGDTKKAVQTRKQDEELQRLQARTEELEIENIALRKASPGIPDTGNHSLR